MVLPELSSSKNPMQGTGHVDLLSAQARERIILRDSFRYLEHSPVGIVVVHGDAHTVVYANASFRHSSGLDDDAILGLPIAGVLESHTTEVHHNPSKAELVALLDGARSERLHAHNSNPSLKVSTNVSVSVGVSASVVAGADTEDPGIWRCKVWPVELDGAWIDQLILELWYAREGESSLVRQREIAERMLLSALREQTLKDENARLYETANAARALAEEAQLQAENAQHDAEAANSAKAQFLMNMSHELRTPLNAISGYAQILEMGLRGAVTEAQKEDLQRIQRSQTHLLGLINAVLNYARLEAGQVVYAMQEVALRDAIVEAESLVKPQLRAKGLRYDYSYRTETADAPGKLQPLVRADGEKVRQILINLLTNAIKYTASDGQVTVTCRTAGATASVSVSDTGRGIPADQLQTVFAPFVQIGRTLSSPDAGVGLGLAISRDLAIGMGGNLTVESVEGEGSTFTLVLPLAG